MIRSLRIGKLEGIEALIEIINNDVMLLERVQTEPYYHNEEIAFNMEGKLLEIKYAEDTVLNADPNEYPRTKFGIQLNHKTGTIQRTLDPNRKEDSVRHKIERAYNHDAKGFLELLKKNKFPEPKNKILKKEMLTTLNKTANYDFTQLLLYKIR